MENKIIPHGIYIKIGPLPMKMCWDLEMARWFSWPTGISYEEHKEVQSKRVAEETEDAIKEAEIVIEKLGFDITRELYRVPRFMLTRGKDDGVF